MRVGKQRFVHLCIYCIRNQYSGLLLLIKLKKYQL